jgi:hypothetical protein
MSNWREHVRVVALIVNLLFVLNLVGSKGWWLSAGFGVPMILAPILAVLALAVTGRRRG